MKSGYKQTEVGVIPAAWNVVRLCEVVDLQVGFAFKSEWFGEAIGTRLLRGENVGYGKADWSETRTLKTKPDSSFRAYLLSPGDIVVGMDRTFTKTGAKITVLYEEDCPCLLVQRVGRFIPRKCDNRFLWFVLSSGPVQSRLRLEQKGMDIPHLSRTEILHPMAAFPSLPEQRAIAVALSDVDGLLGGLDQLIAKKRELKQAAMQQLLTGQTRLPGFHGVWPVKSFAELFNFGGGYSASRDQLSTKGHCYLHYGDIHTSAKVFVDVKAEYQDIPKLDVPLKHVSSSSLLEDGDVVFVDASEDDAGTSKHVVVVNKEKIPFVSGLHTIVAKSKTDELAYAYRQYCFQTSAIRQQFFFYSVGTKVSGISKTNIAKLKMPVPSVPEQAAIADVLTDMDVELKALEQRREKTRALKQAMMQELLTGRTRLL